MASYSAYLIANASWWAVLPSNGISLAIVSNGLLSSASGKLKIDSVTLPLAKVKSTFPFRTNDYSNRRIQPTENNIPLSIFLTCNGYITNTVTTVDYVNMQGSGDSRYSCWAPTTSANDKIFKFDGTVIMDANSLSTISVYVETLNDNNVLTMSTLGREDYITKYEAGINYVGKIEFSDYEENKNPTSISVSPTSGNNNWITNLSQNLKNNSNGIYKDYITKYKLSYLPSNAQLTNVNITTNGEITANYDKNDQIITVMASNNYTNYPNTASFSISVNGGKSTSATVNFYEKPEPELVSGLNQSFSIGNVSSKKVVINTNIKDNSQIAYVMAIGKSINEEIQENFFSYNYNDMLNMSSNSTNKLKIENEGTWQTITYRYYNKIVQTKESKTGTYKYDIPVNVRYYITPNTAENFSYEYIINNHVITDNIPKTLILIGNRTDSLPSIGNFSYNNNTDSGGYCRGFKITFINNKNEEIYNKHVNATIDGNYAKYNGNILNGLDLSNIPFHEYLTITVTPYFYFNDSVTTYYYGKSYIITKFYRFTGEDLLPTLMFPETNVLAPYTKIMLPEVERFGYRFFDEVVLNFGQDIIAFGVDINNKKLMLNDKDFSEYFSTTRLENIVFNIGKYVVDNDLYTPILNIRPFVVIFPNTDYSLRIYDTRTDSSSGNAVLDTSFANIWNRPIANQGEIIKFYDYDNFYNYINKYKYLFSIDDNWTVVNPGYLYEPRKQNQGDVINTGYWTYITNAMKQYAKNMQKYATKPTNFIVLWALPEFKRKKGEIINNNNLKQNFYDLLLQYNNYDNFATHNYLNSNKYTHNTLGNYTHIQITNKEL